MANGNTRFTAYEHAITLFSSYERFSEAVEIQRTMIDEGFIPSLSLRARMASIAVLSNGAQEGDLLELLHGTISNPKFTELALLQLIRFLGDTMGFPPSNLDTIVQTWVKHHRPIMRKNTLSYLIQVHVKRGQLEDAKAWFQHCIDNGTTIDAAPFTDLITGFTGRAHTGELTSTIANMRNAGIAPDLSLFNAVIFGHIKRRHFKDALATYNLLFSSRGKDLTPDKYTFTNMFMMHLKRLKPYYQVYSVKTAKLPPARELYRDLIECHLIHTGGRPADKSDVLSAGVLNLALRLFLQTKDYGAAYNVLQTFHLCRVPANAATVKIVLLPLLAKILKERRKVVKKDSWLRTLLGPGWYQNLEENGSLFSLTRADILERLWVVGLAGAQLDIQPRFSSLDWRANADDRRVINGKINTLASTDLKVLKKIVSRMFFAGAYAMDLDPLIPTAVVCYRKVVEARKDMIPDMDAKKYFLSGKAGRRLKKLAEGGGDKRKHFDLRRFGSG